MDFLLRIVTSEPFQKLGLARGLTTFMGRIASTRMPGCILRGVIRWYIRNNHVNMEEHDGNLNHYRTFNQFFTRELLPGARTFDGIISSPAEGTITASGIFNDGQLFHVKGNSYPLDMLLGQAPRFRNGSFVTIYLSPADYHRFHSPFPCQVETLRHLAGRVQTVNPEKIAKNRLIYCTNERVVMEGNSDYGRFYLVFIGAVVVGKIRINLAGSLRPGEILENLSTELERGDEIGLFELGSTVILVMESDDLAAVPGLTGRRVKLGESLC